MLLNLWLFEPQVSTTGTERPLSIVCITLFAPVLMFSIVPLRVLFIATTLRHGCAKEGHSAHRSSAWGSSPWGTLRGKRWTRDRPRGSSNFRIRQNAAEVKSSGVGYAVDSSQNRCT